METGGNDRGDKSTGNELRMGAINAWGARSGYRENKEGNQGDGIAMYKKQKGGVPFVYTSKNTCLFFIS